MAKKVNLVKINDATLNTLNTFAKARLSYAQEDVRYKAEVAGLRVKVDELLKQRDELLKTGKTVDEATATVSTVDAYNALRLAKSKHDEIIKPFTDNMNKAYELIPNELYDSYLKKINEGKRGDFLNAIKAFLENCGLENVSQSALCRFAENFSDKLGAKVSSSKKLLKDGVFVTATSKKGFNKLFMSIFCDMLIQLNLIDLQKEA